MHQRVSLGHPLAGAALELGDLAGGLGPHGQRGFGPATVADPTDRGLIPPGQAQRAW